MNTRAIGATGVCRLHRLQILDKLHRDWGMRVCRLHLLDKFDNLPKLCEKMENYWLKGDCFLDFRSFAVGNLYPRPVKNAHSFCFANFLSCSNHERISNVPNVHSVFQVVWVICHMPFHFISVRFQTRDLPRQIPLETLCGTCDLQLAQIHGQFVKKFSSGHCLTPCKEKTGVASRKRCQMKLSILETRTFQMLNWVFTWNHREIQDLEGQPKINAKRLSFHFPSTFLTLSPFPCRQSRGDSGFAAGAHRLVRWINRWMQVGRGQDYVRTMPMLGARPSVHRAAKWFSVTGCWKQWIPCILMSPPGLKLLWIPRKNEVEKDWGREVRHNNCHCLQFHPTAPARVDRNLQLFWEPSLAGNPESATIPYWQHWPLKSWLSLGVRKSPFRS